MQTCQGNKKFFTWGNRYTYLRKLGMFWKKMQCQSQGFFYKKTYWWFIDYIWNIYLILSNWKHFDVADWNRLWFSPYTKVAKENSRLVDVQDKIKIAWHRKKKQINCSTCRNFTWPSPPSTGFELTYRDSGNMNHLSIFTMQIFSPSQNIMIPKYNKVSYSKTEKKNFFLLLAKQFQDCLEKYDIF